MTIPDLLARLREKSEFNLSNLEKLTRSIDKTIILIQLDSAHKELEKRCKENLTLCEVIEEMAGALDFYARRKNLEIDPSIEPVNYDMRYADWKVGQPFLKRAEYGQQANKALASAKEKLGKI